MSMCVCVCACLQFAHEVKKALKSELERMKKWDEGTVKMRRQVRVLQLAWAGAILRSRSFCYTHTHIPCACIQRFNRGWKHFFKNHSGHSKVIEQL